LIRDRGRGGTGGRIGDHHKEGACRGGCCGIGWIPCYKIQGSACRRGLCGRRGGRIGNTVDEWRGGGSDIDHGNGGGCATGF
jgi:hypothetical protein